MLGHVSLAERGSDGRGEEREKDRSTGEDDNY